MLALSAHVVALHTLDIAFTGNLDDAQLLPLLQRHCRSLRCLHCGGPRCSITKASLRALPPFLTTLDIAECADIHDFAPLAGLTSLTSLNLGGCRISAEQLLQVCKGCPLTSLDVSCSSVNDTTLVLISALLPRLLD